MRQPSTRLTGVLLLSLVLGLGAGACDDEDEDGEGDRVHPTPSAGPEAPPIPDPGEAFELSASELRDAVRDGARRVAGRAPGAETVRMALQVAELARLWALRAPRDEGLEVAREVLTTASRDRSVPGACEAALALARLEARDEVALQRAHRVAYRTTRRFAGREGATECVAEARRMTRVLDAHRPDPDVLAAIDAHPEGVEERPSVERWAMDRAPDSGPPATLEEVVVYGAGRSAETRAPGVVRVVLRFDRVAVFTRGEIPGGGDDPDRLYLDFERTRLGPGMGGGRRVGAGGLERVRLGRRGEGDVRVVFDVHPESSQRLFFLSDPYRIVVDIERAASRSGAAANGKARRPVRTILLDPGHGGDDYGARHAGLQESQLTLDITRRTARLLERRLPEARILMTRHGDDFVSLEQRTAMANAAGADLFVSVHLNASEEPVAKGGAATFVLDVNDDAQAMRLAARENGTTVEEVTGLQRILATLHRRDQDEASRRLAAQVQRGLLGRARQVVPGLADRGVKEALFYVLVGARMPAVLVEASFLTHPVEAQMLQTDRYRQALADGIAEGIQRYVQSTGR